MRPLSVIVRCLAVAGLGFAALPAFAQSANVTASNDIEVPVTAIRGYVPSRQDDRGATLPAPPPGPIVSRLLAIPEPVDGALPSRARSAAAAPEPTPQRPASGQPVVASLNPVVAAPPSPPASVGSAVASITYMPQSAELSGAARSELDRAVPGMMRLRHVEVRGYAGGDDPVEARKVALARALSARSYLIDRGVRTRIDVDAFVSTGTDGGSERVDIVGP